MYNLRTLSAIQSVRNARINKGVPDGQTAGATPCGHDREERDERKALIPLLRLTNRRQNPMYSAGR